VAVLSREGNPREQTIGVTTGFPEGSIDEGWEKGFLITSLVYGDGKWVLVMTKPETTLHQYWIRNTTFPAGQIREKQQLDFILTHLSCSGEEWVAVVTSREADPAAGVANTRKTRPKKSQPDDGTAPNGGTTGTDLTDEERFALAMKELNQLVGLKKLKEDVDSLLKYIRVEKLRKENGLSANPVSLHAVFSGPPGTGKTTVARLLGKIYTSLGLLKSGHVVEVDRSGLVAEYVGQTAIKTNQAIDRALDGILFIDEAYSLIGTGQGGFGKEAVDTLVKRMEDERGRLVVIVAGYPDEMRDFINANPGLSSRFTQFFTFNDYNPEELAEIMAGYVAERKFTLSPDAGAKMIRYFRFLFESRTKTFGNARIVRNLFEELIRCQAVRLAAVENPTPEELQTITLADAEEALRDDFTEPGEENLDSILAEMSRLTGLEPVKQELRRLAEFVRMETLRKEKGLPVTPPMLHAVFFGPPGTGKTTVARYYGRILKALGILPKGHTVEVSRADLVGKYVGHTAPKTLQVIDRAMHGVLFIDEAYMLVRGGENDFGQEALETLLKRMEDDRDKFVVILAGYEREMEELIDSNPGLQSRFAQYFHFPNYSPAELGQIFNSIAEQKRYRVDDTAVQVLLRYFAGLKPEEVNSLGNARLSRNLFEAAVRCLSERISGFESPSVEQLSTITGEDMQRAIASRTPGI
ncbi:MAG TPA: AAA family ATPase, partial [Bacteroidales bacterium]|nr:AAA family ATPase [Bacteroidales bacterium]